MSALDAVKADVLWKLNDAVAEAENGDFDAAVMWASAANEAWQVATQPIETKETDRG
jgi:hypothetical protein